VAFHGIPAGIYLVELKVDKKRLVKRVTFVK